MSEAQSGVIHIRVQRWGWVREEREHGHFTVIVYECRLKGCFHIGVMYFS